MYFSLISLCVQRSRDIFLEQVAPVLRPELTRDDQVGC